MASDIELSRILEKCPKLFILPLKMYSLYLSFLLDITKYQIIWIWIKFGFFQTICYDRRQIKNHPWYQHSNRSIHAKILTCITGLLRFSSGQLVLSTLLASISVRSSRLRRLTLRYFFKLDVTSWCKIWQQVESNVTPNNKYRAQIHKVDSMCKRIPPNPIVNKEMKQ